MALHFQQVRCAKCGNEFASRRNGQKFCSVRCQKNAYHVRRRRDPSYKDRAKVWTHNWWERTKAAAKRGAMPSPPLAGSAGLSDSARSYMEGLITAYCEAGLSEKAVETQNEMTWLQKVAVKWNVSLDRNPTDKRLSGD